MVVVKDMQGDVSLSVSASKCVCVCVHCECQLTQSALLVLVQEQKNALLEETLVHMEAELQVARESGGKYPELAMSSAGGDDDMGELDDGLDEQFEDEDDEPQNYQEQGGDGDNDTASQGDGASQSTEAHSASGYEIPARLRTLHNLVIQCVASLACET